MNKKIFLQSGSKIREQMADFFNFYKQVVLQASKVYSNLYQYIVQHKSHCKKIY